VENSVQNRSVSLLYAILLLFQLIYAAAAQTGDTSGLSESDRLFALAKSHWAESTSTYVEDLLKKSLVLRKAILPESDPRVAQAEDQLARVYFNRGLLDRKRAEFQKAEALFTKAASGARLSLGQQSLIYADYLGDLGASEREQGRYADAIVEVCKSLKIRRSQLPPDAPVLAASLTNFSRIEAARGNIKEATELQNWARALLDGSVGNGDPASHAIEVYCMDALVS